MGFPQRRTIVLAVLVTLATYALLLPAWMQWRGAYGRGVAAAATAVVLPLLDVEGGVSSEASASVATVYTLRYARTGGWGRVNQRLLNVPDLPLVLAGAVGAVFIPWRRRAILAVAGTVVVFLIHLGLIGTTALRLAAPLLDPALDPSRLDDLLYQRAEQIGAYRDVAPVVVLSVVALLSWALSRPSRRVH